MNELMALGMLDDKLYIAAMKAFDDKMEYRKFFLKMKTNELKLSFFNSIIRNI